MSNEHGVLSQNELETEEEVRKLFIRAVDLLRQVKPEAHKLSGSLEIQIKEHLKKCGRVL